MSESPRRRFTDRIGSSPTFVGAGSTFTGTVACEGDVVVAGRITGNGSISGSLNLLEGARWEGDIEAARAVVAGDVEGTLRISDKLEIQKSARIRGKVSARVLAIAAGAVVDGEMLVTSEAPVVRFEDKRQPSA